MKHFFLLCALFTYTLSFAEETEAPVEEPQGTENPVITQEKPLPTEEPTPLPLEPRSWIAYYGDKMHISNFYPYDDIIFYPRHHPVLAPLLVKGKSLFAYVSLGDSENTDYFFNDANKKKLFIGSNPFNPKRSVIDIRNPKWEEMLLNTILPDIIAEGFNGFCFCNLNVPLNLELLKPEQYQGMSEAVVRLLASIQDHFKGYKMMTNMHGLLHIGPKVLPHTDFLYYENLLTKRNAKGSSLASAQNYMLNLKVLKELQAIKPSLRIYTLDFWPTKETAVIKQIYQRQKENGFIPYVTEDLLKITPAP